MMKIILSSRARKELYALPHDHIIRIVEKMAWFISQKDPLVFAKRLTNATFGTYRFRIGDYRVLCDVHRGVISVLDVLAVRHRSKTYPQGR